MGRGETCRKGVWREVREWERAMWSMVDVSLKVGRGFGMKEREWSARVSVRG